MTSEARDERPTGVVAVMTAHRPDAHIRDVVASARRQVDHLVVVDNTPDGVPGADAYLEPDDTLVLLRNGHNAGLAVALNRGVAASPESPFVLLLDQDSVISPAMVRKLVTELAADSTIGAIGPAPWDPTQSRYLDPRTRLRPDLADLAVIITSGMLVRRPVLASVGPFREDFFVDCVDQEFCLRVKAAGWRVVQDKRTLLEHTLGGTRWHGWGKLRFRATHHPAWRIYWVARNTMFMIREHGHRDPRWAVTAVAILAYWALTILAVEPPRIARVTTLLHGVSDGLRRRTDPTMFPGRRP